MNRQRGLCHPPRHPGWELLRAEAFDVCPRTGRDFHTDRHAVRLLPIAGQQDGAGTSGGMRRTGTVGRTVGTETDK
jgi:hypothetical protein